MTNFMIIFAIVTLWFLYNIYNNEIERQKNLKDLEMKFLIGAGNFQQFKYQMLHMLQIVYEKAAEVDRQYIEDYQKIVETTEKKFNQIGDEWVSSLQNTLGYEMEYKNWEEATRYINSVVSISKKNESRKRDKEDSQ